VAGTIVHLLRHGEVDNPEGIIYGRLTGYKLSKRGELQAMTVAEALAGRSLAHVVASPMERAQQTARPIADAHGLPIATEPALIEACNEFEGMRVAVGDGVLRHPRHWPKLRNPLLPSWGEAYVDIAHRMLGAAHAARARAEGHEAVVVSHQLPIWTLRRFLQAQRLWHDPRSRQCGLASLTSLVFSGPQLIDIVYSEPAAGVEAG
jgi:broad specificity phosphatase PhoE